MLYYFNEMPPKKQSKRNLTDEEMHELQVELAAAMKGEPGRLVLPEAAKARIMLRFGIRRRMLQLYWKHAKDHHAEHGNVCFPFGKKGNGRERFYDRSAFAAAVRALPYHQRGTQRDIAGALGVSVSTVHALKSEDGAVIHSHSAATKPLLNDEQIFNRVNYCLDRLEVNPLDNKRYFRIAHDEIHVDEKWYFIDKVKQTIYVTEEEKEEEDLPTKKTRHKSHMTKVMFLCAVARPRFDRHGNCTFDGKLGIWPFVRKIPAQRSSKRRKKGTLETKCVSVTKEVYLEWMTEKLLPAINAKWPRDAVSPTKIIIQQDGPNVHQIHNEKDWIDALEDLEDLEILLVDQPAQSPDTNINDLGFFASLQADAWKM